MPYIVQADVLGNNAASVTVAEREEAFAIARNWIKSGYTGAKSSATVAFTCQMSSKKRSA
jgi:hypothetical protein